jgi:hypothetical protein
MNTSKRDDSGAATVCSHVASGKFPILYAERSEPIDDIDSGWQFLCDAGLEENIDEAETWSLNEVMEHEPTLAKFRDCSAGTRLSRETEDSEWQVLS